MDKIKDFITIYYIECIISLSILGIVLFLLFLISLIRTNKANRRYNTLVNGIKGLNMEELLIQINENISEIEKDIKINKEDISGIKVKQAFAIQKVGFIRYNAFGNIGSELSFSVALLDDFKNGFVLTSIYGRENSISYGKPIKNGNSNIPLSAEEILAIDRAIKGEGLEKSLY